MVLYVVGSVLQAAVSLGHIRHQQVFYYALGILVEVLRELDFALQYLLINCHRVVIVERVDASNHFVGQNAECPPVDWLAVTLVEEDFRRKIFGSSAQGVGPGLAVLGEAEVGKFEIALLVNKYVFWF